MKILDDLIRREGGYVDNPDDRGGPTKYGITIRTLSTARGTQATKEDIYNLTEIEARDIYESMYVAPFSGYKYHPRLFELLVDAGVNHGVGRVQGWIREINLVNPDAVYREVFKRRLQLYGKLITKGKNQAQFAEGWMNRMCEFVR